MGSGFVFAQKVADHIPFRTFLPKKDLPLTLFRTCAQDRKGFMWFGTAFDGGVARYDGYDWAFFFDDPNDETSISSNHIVEIAFSSTGLMLVTTWEGLNVIDPETMEVKTFQHRPNDEHTLPHPYAHGVVESTQDLFWVGSPAGLALININDGYCENFLLDPSRQGAYNGNYIHYLKRDRLDRNRIWICTDSGLYSMDENRRIFTHHKEPKIFQGKAPWLNWMDIYQDENGLLWICRGWELGGIYTYSPQDDKWTAYQYDGIVEKFEIAPELEFNGIAHGFGDTLFFSSGIGNGYFEMDTKKYSLFPFRPDTVYGHGSGWTAHVVPDRHGRLWWSGYSGITQSLRELTQPDLPADPTSVQITSITLDSIEYLFPPFPKLHFENKENNFKVSFAIPNPENPEEVVYSYRLEGVDLEWTEVKGVNSVEFNDIPAGSYSLVIRGDEGGGWVGESRLPVSVVVPFYQTKAFLAVLSLAGLVVLGLGYLISDWFRKRREKAIRKSFKRQLDEIQMSSLRAQMNPHFLFNSLNSIKYYAISKDKDDTAEYLSKFAMLVRIILNNSKSHTISLKDEIEALRLYIEIEHLRLEGYFDYEIDVDESLHIEQAQIPPMILQPYVENAIWHGLMHKSERGKLRVQVRDLDTKIQCIIDDDGIGRKNAQAIRQAQQSHKKSVGMKITKDRIGLINSLYGIDTQVKVIDLVDADHNVRGTRVIIVIPRISSSKQLDIHD